MKKIIYIIAMTQMLNATLFPGVDLNFCKSKVKQLEKENKRLLKKYNIVHKENARLRKLTRTPQEKKRYKAYKPKEKYTHPKERKNAKNDLLNQMNN